MQQPKRLAPYPSFDGAVAVGMLTDYQARKQELEAIKKDKARKAQIPTKTEELELKGRAIEAQLLRELALMQKSHVTHLKRIEFWQKACKDYLVLGKKHLDLYERGRQQKDHDMATYALPTIQSVLKIAEEDDDQYGKSWFFYRGLNVERQYDLDSKFAEGFNTGIGQLMAEGKDATLRIRKMQQYVVQAEALKKAALRLAAEGGRDTEDAKKEAAELAKKMAELHNGMINANKTGLGGLQNAAGKLTTAAKKKSEAIKVPLKNWEGFYSDVHMRAKTWKAQFKAMQTTMTAGKKGLSPQDLADGEVKRSLTAAEKTFKEAEGHFKLSEATLAQATADIKLLRTFYKK
jgi:hypothetical protein